MMKETFELWKEAWKWLQKAAPKEPLQRGSGPFENLAVGYTNRSGCDYLEWRRIPETLRGALPSEFPAALQAACDRVYDQYESLGCFVAKVLLEHLGPLPEAVFSARSEKLPSPSATILNMFSSKYESQLVPPF